MLISLSFSLGCQPSCASSTFEGTHTAPLEGDVADLQKIFWVAEIFYVVVSTLIRVSILLFYVSIF